MSELEKDKRIKQLERALEFYADMDNYDVFDTPEPLDPHVDCIHNVDQDAGMTARAALGWLKATSYASK